MKKLQRHDFCEKVKEKGIAFLCKASEELCDMCKNHRCTEEERICLFCAEICLKRELFWAKEQERYGKIPGYSVYTVAEIQKKIDDLHKNSDLCA